MPCSRWTTRSPSLQLAEIDLRAAALPNFARALETTPAVSRRATEKLGCREYDEIGRRKTKAAGERSFDQVDPA